MDRVGFPFIGRAAAGHAHRACVVRLHPSGLAFTLGRSGALWCWDFETGKVLAREGEPSRAVLDAPALTSGGRFASRGRLASAGVAFAHGPQVAWWNDRVSAFGQASPKRFARLATTPQQFLAFLGTGDRAAVRSREPSPGFHLISPLSAEPASRLVLAPEAIVEQVLDLDAEWLAVSTSADVRLVSSTSGATLRVWPGMRLLDALPGGRFLLAANGAGEAALLDLKDGAAPLPLSGAVGGGLVRTDGSLLTYSDTEVQLWEPGRPTPRRRWAAGPGLSAMLLLPGRLAVALLVQSLPGPLLLDLEGGGLEPLPAPEDADPGALTDLVVLGPFLVGVSDTRLLCWESATGVFVGDQRLKGGPGNRLAADPAGRAVVCLEAGEPGTAGPVVFLSPAPAPAPAPSPVVAERSSLPSRALAGHSRAVVHVALAEHGRTAVSTGADGETRVWSVELTDLRQLHSTRFEQPPELLPGGAFLLGRCDGQLGCFGVEEGRLLLSLPAGPWCACPVAAERPADTLRLAVATGASLTLWGLPSGKALATLDLSGTRALRLLDAGGGRLAVVLADPQGGLVTRLVSTAGGELLGEFAGALLDVSPSGALGVFPAGRDAALELVALDDPPGTGVRHLPAALGPHGQGLRTFLPDGRLVTCAPAVSPDSWRVMDERVSEVRVWGPPTWRPKPPLRFAAPELVTALVAVGRDSFATLHEGGALPRLFAGRGQHPVALVRDDPPPRVALQILRTAGRHLAALGPTGLWVWRAPSGELVGSRHYPAGPRCLAASAHGRLLVGHPDGGLELVELG